MNTPVAGFAAYSGTGKTTLLEAVVTLLREQGLHIGVVKHAHHDFDIDTPGKDSYRIRKAGAEQMLVASRHRWALMVDIPTLEEPPLDELLERLDLAKLDIVFVEGLKFGDFPKIELHRPSLGKPLIFPDSGHIIAIATDAPLEAVTDLPILDLNDPLAIAHFIRERFL